MSSLVTVKVFYAKGIRVTLSKRSFQEAMILIFKSPAFSDYEPLKIVFTSTGKTLYADRQAFLHYLNGDFNLEALVQHTQCDDLYRNTKDLLTDDDTTIDHGSLWKAIGKVLTLVDDENHVTAKMNKLLFEIAE